MTPTERLSDDRLRGFATELQNLHARVTDLDRTLTEARQALATAILDFRAQGMTVPQVARALDMSEANIFRISANAKAAAATPGT